MRKIAITGANGFIGYHLVKEFIKDSLIVFVLRPTTLKTNRLKEFKDVKDNTAIIYHDIKEPFNQGIIDFFKKYDIDTILHAGGNPSSSSSFVDSHSVLMDNVIGTNNVLTLAKETNVKNFVYYGAAESFGPRVSKDSNEDDKYNCHSVYAASKASGEELCSVYSKNFDLKTSVVHIANTFGEKCQANRFPVVAMRSILNGDKLKISAVDGMPGFRRWFHAGDVALHTRFILDNQELPFEKWNSSGVELINNLSFAEMIANVAGKKLDYELVELDKNSHTAKLLINSIDSSKLYKRGYVDTYTMEERLAQTINWYKENPSWFNIT